MIRITSALLILLSISLSAQKRIELKNIVDGTFKQKSVDQVNWMNDGQYYSALKDNKVVKYDISSGDEVAILANGDELELDIDGYTFSKDEGKLLLLTDREPVYRRSFTAVYYVYTIADKSLEKLSADRQAYATFSPNGAKVAFTRENNLFVTDLTTKSEKALTTDGQANSITNGSSDWVYEEELFITKAFQWSPSSDRIAYYRFDESAVPEYNMQTWNDNALYPEDYRFKYPKAGEANSKIEIYIHDLTSDNKVAVDIGPEVDIYIPRIYWTKDNNLLSVQLLNRLQNKLDILHVNATDGSSNVVLTDESDTYIDFTFLDDLTYLDNGKEFIFSSEKSGYKHFYLHKLDGSLVKQITSGNFEAVSLVGLDQKSKTLYYISTETSPLDRQLYSIKFTGKGKKLLTETKGSVSVNMSPDAKYHISYYQSAERPLLVELYQTPENQKVKALEQNEELIKTAGEYGLATKEFFSYTTSQGTELSGFFLKPNDFDPNKLYPVLLYQYSGPGSQVANNSWGTRTWHQYLVQNGYVVAVVDNRGTGFRGESFKKMTYKQLGKLEVEDHIETAKYLSSLNFVDKHRIGIWGWSYGGYMSSLAIMKGADYFKAAIAVAPVTSWRYYDTIYTERYLQRPQENAAGYDDNSPIAHVEKLKGKFLLIHGTGDDNVHFQNAVALQNELIKAGKQFQSFYYPDLAHGLGYHEHLYQMMSDFIFENL